MNASGKNGTLDMFANYEIILFKTQKWFQYEVELYKLNLTIFHLKFKIHTETIFKL